MLSWRSNTAMSGVILVIIIVATVVVDLVNGQEPPPTYLTGLLGLSAGSFFGAIGTDRSRRSKAKRSEDADESVEDNS